MDSTLEHTIELIIDTFGNAGVDACMTLVESDNDLYELARCYETIADTWEYVMLIALAGLKEPKERYEALLDVFERYAPLRDEVNQSSYHILDVLAEGLHDFAPWHIPPVWMIRREWKELDARFDDLISHAD